MDERARILATLTAHRAELVSRYGVRSLALFGSAARGEAGPNSDIDLLVEFDAPPGFDRYMALKWRLEELVGRPVDLVMASALAPWALRQVRDEALRVA